MRGAYRSGVLAGVGCLVWALGAGSATAQPPRTITPPDIAGEWALQNDEDPGQLGALGQPPLGDYLGIPFNEAGRMRADTTPESIWGTPEYQCRPHSAPHQWRGLGGARILKEQDPLTREVRAYHIQFMRSLDRPVFMDGRPHPPAWAPHTWTGFSTGQWIGNTLKITTTHLKDGYLKRGGPQTSDLYTMTEYLTRHDEILTITTVVDDPVYMDEPYVQSTTYVYDPTASVQMETCNASAFAENGGTDRHWVPHFLPGTNTAWKEWLKNEPWVPEPAVRGGVTTLYPEYRSTLSGSRDPQPGGPSLKVPSSRSSLTLSDAINSQGPRDGAVHVLPVQGNVYMLIADGVNLAASVGPDGVLLVNSGSAAMTEKVQAALAQLAATATAAPLPNRCSGANCPGLQWGWASPYINTVISSPQPPKPVRYILNTNDAADHVGGNARIAASGFFPRGGGFGSAVTNFGRSASVVAHENVLSRMSASVNKQPPAYPEAAWPTDTFFDELHKLPEYVNGEAVIVYHAPAASTDADSLVFFRHSEVIHAGSLFSTISYPVIDLQKGGTIQGVIDGLNQILDLAVAEYRAQGGTWIIPSRGRLSDTADVASYRNMLVMVRDRVRDLKQKGQTLAQVKAARPTLDFDGRYGSTTGAWTTDMFVEAVYRTLPEKKP
jgi:glyoxylase-like metal-dependent hydrolase (beta-lactamase superfamily II)